MRANGGMAGLYFTWHGFAASPWKCCRHPEMLEPRRASFTRRCADSIQLFGDSREPTGYLRDYLPKKAREGMIESLYPHHNLPF